MFGVVLAISVHPYPFTHGSQGKPVQRVMWGCNKDCKSLCWRLKYNESPLRPPLERGEEALKKRGITSLCCDIHYNRACVSMCACLCVCVCVCVLTLETWSGMSVCGTIITL